MVDVMKKTGLDPRKPGFEAIAEHMKAADSLDVLPEHSQDHFKGNPGVFAGKVTTGPQVDLFGNRVKERPEDKRNIGEINSISPFMYNKFIPMLSEYHKVHDRVIKAFKKHGNSMIDLGGALKDLVPGLGVKTGLFAAGMAGGGNAVVPDTHHIRRTFGFHLHNDADTIKKVKDEMWDPENYQNTMRPYARWFAKNNPAVQHLLKNPKFAHMFKGHEEDAAFPGFWLDWQAIQPWEKMKGLPTLSNTGTATHKPVWDAFSQFAKSETDNLDSTLPLRTALVHRKYEENYGEMPATFLYYANVVPKLLEAAEHRKKFEAGLSFLAKSREIEAELVELKKTVRETLEGSRVPMPEVYRVDIKHGDKTNPAGRYMIHNGKISHLEDYHGVLDAVLPEGPINADAIAKLHGLKLSNNFQVRQHEPKENEEPQEVRARLPQVDVSLAPTPKRPPVFEYFRPGLQKPHVVEFSKEGAALDGQKLDQRELALMLENANQGLASIKWKKSEEPLNKAERLMAPTEALQQIRELVSKGLVHPDIERSLTQHIYADPMTGVGNKLAYREFRDQNRPGVWASIDLNSFKHVNDTYGHDTGDDAIKAVGGALREAGRKVGTGKMWRPGGDEFVSWHPSYEEASQFVRHAKNHVDALPPVNGVHRHSFSVGLGNDFKTADKALLLAKKQKFDPETKQLRFLPGKTPHLGHSLVPGTEGPLPLESEAPPQHVLPKGQPQLSP
jgi:diguanylate cyclase (GGDEF)-like protein